MHADKRFETNSILFELKKGAQLTEYCQYFFTFQATRFSLVKTHKQSYCNPCNSHEKESSVHQIKCILVFLWSSLRRYQRKRKPSHPTSTSRRINPISANQLKVVSISAGASHVSPAVPSAQLQVKSVPFSSQQQVPSFLHFEC